MFMLFYKHLINLYRCYSKSLHYFGSSPVHDINLKEALGRFVCYFGEVFENCIEGIIIYSLLGWGVAGGGKCLHKYCLT